MNRFISLVICLLGLFLPVSATAMSDLEWTFSYALTHKTPPAAVNLEAVILGMERSTVPFSEEYLDILAEITLLQAQDIKSDRQRGLLRRVQNMGEVLVRTNNPRYVSALRKLGKMLSVNSGGYRSKKWPRYLNKHRKTQVSQFQAGSIELEKLREDFVDQAKNMELAKGAKLNFDSIVLRSGVDELFDIMGRPQAVSAIYIKIPFITTIVRLTYFYKNLGRVAIELSGKTWSVVEINPGTADFEFQMPYFNAQNSSDPTTRRIVLNGILNGSNYVVKSMASSLLKQTNGVDDELLDIFAELLYRNYQNNLEGQDADAYAWVIKLLGEKNRPRYAVLINEVAAKSDSEKLRRYGDKYKSKSATVDNSTYRLGSLDIDALKKRYSTVQI